MRKRKALDLFKGTGSATEAFEDTPDWEVVGVELDPRFEAEITADVLDLTVADLAEYGPFDFVWASPPCTSFSVASFRHHWDATTPCHNCGAQVKRLSGEKWDECCDEPMLSGELTYKPTSQDARVGRKLVAHTIRLIAGLRPKWWVLENPRGMLRKLDVVKGLPRRTVTYCQYGSDRMKPTDLWGWTPMAWTPMACSNGADCHVSAPRGSKTGTQGRSKVARSMVPYDLGYSLLDAAEHDLFNAEIHGDG